MNCGEHVNAKTRKRILDQCILGAVILLAILVQCGCATADDTRDSATTSTGHLKGDGIAIGSILLSAPVRQVIGADERRIVESLKAKKYEARIRRRVVYEYGLASRIEYLGETVTVSLEVDVDKPFLVRGPAGTYAILDISQIVSGIFGERNTACVLDGPGRFEIREGTKNYVGRLTIAAHFMSEGEVATQRALQRARGVYVIGRPESLLTMKGTISDVKDETLRGLGMGQTGAGSGLDTLLMRASERISWNCEVPSIPPPPGAPRRPGS